jgi:hypothetical protein
MKTVLSSAVTAIGFQATQRSIDGTSKLRSLPNVKHKNVKKHFGSDFAVQRKDVYSDSHTFTEGLIVFTLYMADGEWRFGCNQYSLTDYEMCLLKKLGRPIK